TTSNTITKEANVIGTLRAMGYSKGELIRHYMFLPTMVTIAGSVAGNILGYTVFKNLFVNVYYTNYSLPNFKMLWNMNAFLETTIVPFVLTLVINFATLAKKLKISPLNFIRGELKENGQKHLIKLPKKMPFFSKFRLRIFFQNVPSYLTLALGIFLAGVLVVFGTMYGPLLDGYSDMVKESQISKYQYIMIDEAKTKIDGAEKFCMTSLQTTDEKFMTDDVTVYGIESQSKYITQSIPSGTVLISSAAAEKFGLSEGDEFKLKEPYKTDEHSFKIGGVYKYDAAITVFMNRSDYLNEFNEDLDYFNGYFSNKKLSDLNDDDYATVITEKDLTKVVTQMQVSMMEFVKIFQILGVVIFLLVMYILTKQIIEKNSKSVSMSKILGFTDIEIGKLYLIMTSFVVIVSLLIAIPLISLALHWCFKSYIYTMMTGYIPYIISDSCYVTMFVLGIVSYAVVAGLMLLKIKKTPLGEALKNQSL
ncbi:MAG: FtsX-like permease family protein, partial [Clostridia bacterium]|nr:FtsX-like permease family protein [Clostridia bacterium]